MGDIIQLGNTNHTMFTPSSDTNGHCWCFLQERFQLKVLRRRCSSSSTNSNNHLPSTGICFHNCDVCVQLETNCKSHVFDREIAARRSKTTIGPNQLDTRAEHTPLPKQTFVSGGQTLLKQGMETDSE